MKKLIYIIIYFALNSFTQETLNYQEIFKTLLQYGFLGIVAYAYIDNNKKVSRDNRSQFSSLIQQILDNDTKKFEKIDISINSLVQTIERANRFYDSSLSDIATELSKQREDYKSISSQTVECFLDEKILSKSNFTTLYKMLVLKHIHQTINDISYKIDQNGFDTELAISLLKENVLRILDRRKSEMLLILNQCNYREDKILKLKNNIEIYYSMTIQKIEGEVFKELIVEELITDKNYKRTKQLFQNKLFELSDKILSDTELL